MKYVLALDAGTTSVRAFVYELKSGRFTYGAQRELKQSFPAPGWVEQDAEEIYEKAVSVLSDCIAFVGGENVAGMGIANQRETVILWSKATGKPICPAIVWQCRRTAEYCAALSRKMKSLIKARTGLVADAYFSASKIRWVLDHVPEAEQLLKDGNLCAGTVDSWLIWKLTKGRTFATDYTNASRTMLFNIKTLEWDRDLLARFSIPRDILPEARPSDAYMGESELCGISVPVAGVLGDQQAALFGQGCLSAGEGKITYGTGLFFLFNTGKECVKSKDMLTTIAYTVNGNTSYALEGSAFNAGSAVQWLRDELQIIKTSAESEEIATGVEGSGGVFFVPAFTGLGAPYWDSKARGLFCGITRSTSRAHLVRAVLESIAFGARDLTSCMERDSKLVLREIRCDGGASANGFLMQFQSDVLGAPVDLPAERESTALGAALMCAVSRGLIDAEQIPALRKSARIYSPSSDREKFDGLYSEYKKAVHRTLLK